MGKKRKKNKKLRADGLINSLSGLGTAKDKRAGTSVAYARRFGREEIDELYEGSRFVQRFCGELPRDAIKRGVTVLVTDADEPEPYADEIEQLGFLAAARRAHTYARQYGGAALILLTSDGQLDKPIPPTAELLALHVEHRHNLKPLEWVTDLRKGIVHEPSVYEWTLLNGTSMRVAAEHVVRFEGIEIPKDRAPKYDYWGLSYIAAAWEAIEFFATAGQACTTSLHEINQTVFKIRNLAGIVAGPQGETKLAARFAAVNLSKSMVNAVVIDTDGEEYTELAKDVSGLAELYVLSKQNLSGAFEISQTRLFGDSPSGLSTDDMSGRSTWADHVRAAQKDVYTPALRRVLEIIAPDAEYVITWPPQFEPTEKEAAETREKQSVTDERYWEMQVLFPNEIRDSRFGGQGYSAETVLDPDAVAEIEAAAAPFEPEDEPEVDPDE